MERPIIEDINALGTMCQPIVEYIKEKRNPYISVHITEDNIQVISVECEIPLLRSGD